MPLLGKRLPGALLVVLLLAALVLACGKRGRPLPPLPHGPHPPGGVRARQIGRVAQVAFDVPEARGPKPAQQPVQAELVRVSYPPGPAPAPDPDSFRRRGEVVGETRADPLPPGRRMILEDRSLADLAENGVGWTVRYGVRVRDVRGRSSTLVVAKDLVPMQERPAASGLRGEPTADGIRLLWTAPAEAEGWTYNVYRSTKAGEWPEVPLNPEPLAATEYLDSEVDTGLSYRYTVRGALAPAPPYRESEPSAVCELIAADRFAPGAPLGLVAVQEAGSVRLFWNPNPERDLSGYRVYRRVEDRAWVPVGPETLDQTQFLDRDVEVGQRLAYRVTAVDRATPPNESEPSGTMELELVREPEAPGQVDR